MVVDVEEAVDQVAVKAPVGAVGYVGTEFEDGGRFFGP